MSQPNLPEHFSQLSIHDNSNNELITQLTRIMAQQQQQIQQLLDVGKAPSTLEPRPADPPKFGGTSLQETPDFLASVKNIFKLCPKTYSTDAQKIGYVGSLLVGIARSWFRLQADMETFDSLSFNEFETRFRKRFGDPFAKLSAQRRLSSLRQGSRSALVFSTEFYELAQEAEFNDSAMICGLYQGLNEEVKDAMAFIPERPDTFLEFSQLVISVDNRLFERRNERKGRQNQPYFSTNSGKAPPPREPKPGDDPMNVDVSR